MGILLTEQFGALCADAESTVPCEWIWHEFSDAEVPRINTYLILVAVGAMKAGKTCADDRIVAEMLFSLPEEAMRTLADLFRCILRNDDPHGVCGTELWLHVAAVLLKKVLHVKFASELRGISILPTVRKLFSSVLLLLEGDHLFRSIVLNLLSRKARVACN